VNPFLKSSCPAGEAHGEQGLLLLQRWVALRRGAQDLRLAWCLLMGKLRSWCQLAAWGSCRALCLRDKEEGYILKPKSLARDGKPCSQLSLSCRYSQQVTGAGTLAPWNDRGAPGASSSSLPSLAPPRALTPTLQPPPQTHLQARPGQAPGCAGALVGVSLAGHRGPPSPLPRASPASLPVAPGPLGHGALPALCRLPFPQRSSLRGFTYRCSLPPPLASTWWGKAPGHLQLIATLFSDLRTISSLPCFQVLNNVQILSITASQLPNVPAAPSPACPVHGIPSTPSLLLSQSPRGPKGYSEDKNFHLWGPFLVFPAPRQPP